MLLESEDTHVFSLHKLKSVNNSKSNNKSTLYIVSLVKGNRQVQNIRGSCRHCWVEKGLGTRADWLMVTKVAHSGHSRPAPDTTWCKQQAEEGWEIMQINANESSAFESLSPGPRNSIQRRRRGTSTVGEGFGSVKMSLRRSGAGWEGLSVDEGVSRTWRVKSESPEDVRRSSDFPKSDTRFSADSKEWG